MANPNAPDFSTPGPKPLARLAQTMAYGSGVPAPNGVVVSQLHRLRRGFPFMRAGIQQPPIPQFKGLTIYTQASHLPTAANPTLRAVLPPVFRQSTTSTRVRWTTSPTPNASTS